MSASRALALALFCAVWTPTLRADFTQQPDETLPGFKSQQVYDFNGVDNVNLFSGELHLAVPLGPEYPLSSGLKWRLTAHYSSKLWHMWLGECGASGSCPGRLDYAHRAQLAGTSTLGVGWILELGSVRPPVGGEGAAYKAPDGSTHFGQTTGNPDPNANLRLDPRRPDGTYVVRQADGTVSYFEHLYSIPTPANGFDFSDEDRYPGNLIQTARYGLSRIVDRFGKTVLRVNYQANCSGTPCPANAWMVSSIQLASLGRTIVFNWRTYPGSGTFYVLDGIQFPLSDGNAPGDSITAAFSYLPSGTLYRSFDFGGSQTCPASGPGTTNVPFLAGIVQGTRTFSFRYESPGRGLLLGMTLPTGGAVTYVYQGYTVGTPGVCDLNCTSPEIGPGGCAAGGVVHAGPPFAALTDPNNCDDMSYYMQFIDSSPAVITRTETGLPSELPGGAAVVSITNYERDEVGSPLTPGYNELDPQRVVRRVLVHRTDGNGNPLTDKYVFSAGVGVQQGAELSHRTYTNCSGAEPPVRSSVQCFRRPDSNVCGVMETPTRIHNLYIVDLLPSRRETWYGTNPIPDVSGCATSSTVPCWQDEFTGYNAAALEYTTATRSSPSGVLFYPLGASRTTTTAWTPTAPGEVPWLPKLFSAKTVTDAPCMNAPCSVTTSTSFDASNGFLLSSATTDGTTGTLTQSFTRDPLSGDPVTETLSASFDATSFTNTRTYQGGLATSVRRTAPAGIGWPSFDVSRNSYTGRITVSRDPNGLATAYGYDGSQRLASVSPPEGETPTTYCTLDWSTSREMSVVLAKRGGPACSVDDSAPGPGSGPFEAFQYDGFGRVKREIRRLPNPLATGGVFAFREFRYNAAGLKSFESEWSPCDSSPSPSSVRSCYASFAAKGTTYGNFDFLGRPRTIQLADGKTIRKSFDDPAGIPNSDFTELVSATVAGVSVNSASRKDILGRLLLAAEPAPAPALYGRYTAYYYNVLDTLASMTLPLGTGDPAHDPPAAPQSRTFAYDALGLLRSEVHPEKGTITYAAYNALGEVTAKVEGGNSYAYAYDALGRLRTTTANGLLYLSNLYDIDVFGGVVAGNRVLGKLAQQNASHPLSDQNIWVAHNFGYGGLGGRLSIDENWAILGNSVLFYAPTRYSWNALGLLGTHDHARSGAAWSASTTYVSGLPVSLTADGRPFVTSATYNPSGGLLSYRTANGVTTTFDPDPNLMPRPLQIRTTGADFNFSTGAYGYDGSGNIVAIGSDLMRYDARGHLTLAEYSAPGLPFDEYEYDAYGNQTRRSWELGRQDLITDPATNRLTGSSYDALGNLTRSGPDQHAYDALSRQTRYVGPGANERYYYDGAGERLARVVFASALPKQSVQESFFNLAPCRILDTRLPGGVLGGPPLPGQGARSFPVTGICGIPSNAKALALNVATVPNATTAARGNVRLYPTGLSYQPLGTANAYKAGYARAIQFFGSIDGPTAGSFTLFNDAPAGSSVDVVVDVQGYFAPGASAPPQTGDSWFLTVRDLDKRPSTEFRYDTATGQTAVLKDYVYLGNQLVGTYTTTGTPNGTVFYTNDHLGSPRFLTAGASPTKLAEYRYRAFGLALTSTIPGQGPEFASMERDLASSDLYDHARYVGGKLGRFKSADQLGGHTEDPQSWNRYAYARNNPLKFVDRDGRSPIAAALPLFGPLITIPLTPAQWAVLVAGSGYAAGRAVGRLEVGGMTIDERVTRLFTGLIAGPDKVETDPLALSRGGDSPAAKYGREQHKNWNPGEGFDKEVTLPSGRRADAVNPEIREVRELKPDNPKAVRRGEKQVERYKQELENETGQEWTGKVVTYRRPPD